MKYMIKPLLCLIISLTLASCGAWVEDSESGRTNRYDVLLEANDASLLTSIPGNIIGVWDGEILGKTAEIVIQTNGEVIFTLSTSKVVNTRVVVDSNSTQERLVKDLEGNIYMTDLTNNQLLKLIVTPIATIDILHLYDTANKDFIFSKRDI